jgi:hypothetical protein
MRGCGTPAHTRLLCVIAELAADDDDAAPRAHFGELLRDVTALLHANVAGREEYDHDILEVYATAGLQAAVYASMRERERGCECNGDG